MAISHIVIAMKPVEGNFVENSLKHGVAGLNIAQTRIASPAWKGGVQTDPRGGGFGSRKPSDGSILAKGIDSNPAGRWPANVILGHHKNCKCAGMKKVKATEGFRPNPVGVQSDGKIRFTEKPVGYKKISYSSEDGNEQVEAWQCVEGCPVRVLGEQSGESRASMDVMDRPNFKNKLYGTGMGGTVSAKNQHNDAGTAARFFKQVSEFQEEK